jgi:hypothetical protein
MRALGAAAVTILTIVLVMGIIFVLADWTVEEIKKEHSAPHDKVQCRVVKLTASGTTDAVCYSSCTWVLGSGTSHAIAHTETTAVPCQWYDKDITRRTQQ